MRTMSLSVKLTGGFVLVALLTLVVGFMGWRVISQVTAALTEVKDVRLPSIAGLQMIDEAQTSIEVVERTLLIPEALADKATYNRQLQNLEAGWKKVDKGWRLYEPLPQTKEEEVLWNRFKSAWEQWKQCHQQVLDLIKSDKREAALAFSLGKGRETFLEAEKLLDELSHLNEKIGEETVKNTIGNVDQPKTLILTITAVSFVIALVLGIFLSISISRPLATLSRQAKLLAEGDLRQDISLARNDEIGELAQSLSTVIQSWQSMIQKILDGAVKLSTAAAEIAATSEEMSRGADSQMTQILKTSSGMEEMSGSIQEVSRNAQNTSEAAVAASSLASEGSVKVKDTVARIAAVNESIKKLNQRSQEIGKVVQLIGEIAAQTNILSLNAAIEAARAGEHGRGFEVVAEEIRKLAQRTTESTAEIAALIEEIKNENQEAARMMEAGTVMATEAGQTLENIVGGIVSTTDMVQVISSAAAQQARAAEEIAEALQSISGVSKQTVTASRETVKATQDLSALADQLKEVTGQFRI